jgi:hypothetical protein
MKFLVAFVYCIIILVNPTNNSRHHSTMPMDDLLDNEDLVLIAVEIALSSTNYSGAVRRPYNNLPFSGMDYTLAILQGNPWRTIDVFQVTTPTFMFLCDGLLAIQLELCFPFSTSATYRSNIIISMGPVQKSFFWVFL